MRTPSARERLVAALAAAEGVLLAWGVEACFGVGRYRLIMLLGVLGGLGAVVVGRMVMADMDRGGRAGRLRALLWGLFPAIATFAAWFVWRVVPLIREEMKYSL